MFDAAAKKGSAEESKGFALAVAGAATVVLILSNLFAIWVVRHERFIYYWDFATYSVQVPGMP